MNGAVENSTRLLRRIRAWTLAFMVGLVVSGATAIPLQSELKFLVKWTGAEHASHNSRDRSTPAWAAWLLKVSSALDKTTQQSPFLYYGTDWLAFGHFVIAVAFIGALLDPLRNQWLFRFGMIACVLVIPYALMFGTIRGIPPWWRIIDCSFGLFALIPLFLCSRWVRELQQLTKSVPSLQSEALTNVMSAS